jgi:phosphoribosylformylglycinamidine synthase subunit PurS
VKARVLVYPRREVLDPQAKAIHHALALLGFDDVVEVHAGKAFEIEVSGRSATAEQRLRAMCDKLLANPIMERYSIELLPAGRGAASQGTAASDGEGSAKQAKEGVAGKAKQPKAPTRPEGPTRPKAPAKPAATAGTAGGKPEAAKSPRTAPKTTPVKTTATTPTATKSATTKSATTKSTDKKGTRK